LPLGAPVLLNVRHDASTARDAHGAAALGVLANLRVVDVMVARVGTATEGLAASTSGSRVVLVAVLADGELAVYARAPDAIATVLPRGDESHTGSGGSDPSADAWKWTRVDFGFTTRGLRGRPTRPRKYAQPIGAPLFRGPLLFRFRNVGGFEGVFFA